MVRHTPQSRVNRRLLLAPLPCLVELPLLCLARPAAQFRMALLLLVAACPSPAIGGSGPAATGAVFTADRQTYTALPGKPIVIDGSTLAPGSVPITVDVEAHSVGLNGIIEDGSTIGYSAITALRGVLSTHLTATLILNLQILPSLLRIRL